MVNTSRLFVDFGVSSQLWQTTMKFIRQTSLSLPTLRPGSPLETKRPLHRRCQRMRARTHRKAAKASNKDSKLIYRQKEKQKRIFVGMRFFFTSKKLEIRPDMIARLGSSRPEKSRGRHFKSPSFVLFIFFRFFFLYCWWWLVVAPTKFEGALFRY